MSAGMLTHSGRLVTPGSDIPSLSDMALGLLRTSRFSGQTRRWWSVLHHTLWLRDYVHSKGRDRELEQGILLHDAHEALTGDISTHFKTDDMRRLQEQLDRRILAQWFPGGYSRYLSYREQVKHWDRVALLSEAAVVGPPALEHWESPPARELFALHFGSQPVAEAVTYLERWLELNGDLLDPAILTDADEPFGPAHLFITLVTENV
jgi:hypothetical protein